jgi:hypothetical protein
MKNTQNLFILFFVILFVIFMPVISMADDSYTIADVAAVQDSSLTGVQTMAASVSSTTEYNGMKQTLAYDYSMQTDSSGNNKVMVTTKGIFTMQFLIDTSDMSVTYLMADGSHNKVTASAEVKDQIKQMAGISGLKGFGGTGSMYAALGIKKGSMSDAAYANKYNTGRFETDDMVVSVKGKKKGGFMGMITGNDTAEVEYINKKMDTSMEKWDKGMDLLKNTKSATAEKEKVKQKALEWMATNRGKARKSMVTRNVEHINMKTGIVEEHEMYNADGERMGHMKVTGKRKIKAGKEGKEDKIIEMPVEMETEMKGSEGDSTTKTKMEAVTINEPVSFEWMKVKK